jgi:hypothetical protein
MEILNPDWDGSIPERFGRNPAAVETKPKWLRGQ